MKVTRFQLFLGARAVPGCKNPRLVMIVPWRVDSLAKSFIFRIKVRPSNGFHNCKALLHDVKLCTEMFNKESIDKEETENLIQITNLSLFCVCVCVIACGPQNAYLLTSKICRAIAN